MISRRCFANTAGLKSVFSVTATARKRRQMNQKDIEQRVADIGLIVKKGVVYRVFDCCITTSARQRIMCQDHLGLYVTKFKICTKCGKMAIGRAAMAGKTCQSCRIKKPKPQPAEHKRGLYCKHYIVEDQGCFFSSDCWYCETFNPIFTGTGPKRRVKKL